MYSGTVNDVCPCVNTALYIKPVGKTTQTDPAKEPGICQV